MAVYKQDYTVNIAAVNSSGLITNTGIISILEDAAAKHSDSVGFGIKDIPTKHLSWVLLAWKIHILKRPAYGTKLTVHTWAKGSYRFYTCRDFEVYNANNELVCIASSKWTLIDTKKGMITRITDDIINEYEPNMKDVFGSSDIEKLDEPTTFSNEYIYTAQRRDIDVNNHMHNLNYLYVAYEALPEEVYMSKEFNNIEIMYKKGIRLGNTVKCLYSYTQNAHYVTIKSLDNAHLHAIVKLY